MIPVLKAEGYEVISCSAGHDQDFFASKRGVSDTEGQVPLLTSAAVTGAQAGLNWLRADPPDLEEVRRALDGIANDGKRAAEIVIRLRALIEKVS